MAASHHGVKSSVRSTHCQRYLQRCGGSTRPAPVERRQGLPRCSRSWTWHLGRL